MPVRPTMRLGLPSDASARAAAGASAPASEDDAPNSVGTTSGVSPVAVPGGAGASSAADQRVDPRAPITLRVDYKRLNTFFADYTKNISKGGTFIRTSKPLAIGTDFVFVLTLPTQGADGPGEQLRLLGQVVWVVLPSESSELRPSGMGIRFDFKDERERATVHRFVEGLMARSLGDDLSARLLHPEVEPT